MHYFHDHIKRLEQKEIIKRINKEGKLLLIVNPMLLSISPNFEHIRAVLWENFKNCNLNKNNDLDFSRAKTFPINYPSGNIKSIITKSVDMLKKESHSDRAIQETVQETQKTKQDASISQEKIEYSASKINCSEQDRKQEQAPAVKHLAFRQKQFIQRQAMILWLWCVEHLYADLKFIAEGQQEYAIEYFTNAFEGKQGTEIYKEISLLRTRLGKWKRFVSKSATIKRFTPLPSSFFNLNNPHGFIKTESWLHQEMRKTAYNQAWKLARKIERSAAQILAGHYPEKKTNPLTKRKETYYRELTTSEKLRELQKLEYRINKLSEKFPNIGKWYSSRLKEIINLVETKKAA